MRVLVDTSIWSLALRRRETDLSEEELALLDEWRHLVTSGRAALIGLVRQELLSGLKSRNRFEELQERLSAFVMLVIEPADYDTAAQFFNTCRAHGIAGSAVDMLICSVAHRHRVSIFARDGDFPLYARHLPIRLHAPRSARAR